jgi:hypothetical protein
MLMSLPNSVGMEPAILGGLFQQVVDSFTERCQMSKWGRTGQFVAVETKAGQVDEHAEFRGH